MKKHIKIYFDFFGYDRSDFIQCEIDGCGQRAVDINHIDARRIGGNPSGDKDNIFNLMAMCRECHIKYGDKKQFKDELKTRHLFVMAEMQPRKTEEMLNDLYDKIDFTEENNQL